MTSGIYQIKNNISGGVYFGRSVDVHDRLIHHRNELRRNVHRNKRLQNAWNKYGENSFKFELVWENSPQELYELEGFVLEFMWGHERLYNHHKLSYGGFEPGNKLGCFSRSAKTKERLSKAFTGRQFSDEHRAKISKTKTGLKASEETKKKMSDAKVGKPRPQSWHDKMAEYRAKNPVQIIACEHCKKEMPKSNYTRWHGANCKHKE